jgi:hypothetical protein
MRKTSASAKGIISSAASAVATLFVLNTDVRLAFAMTVSSLKNGG